ncbi:MAG: SRPBCC domain-containing protein [Chloroflexi bacterium]|nr:SRPBCC domain-containing protein [Chloroflexota bacterium]
MFKIVDGPIEAIALDDAVRRLGARVTRAGVPTEHRKALWVTAEKTRAPLVFQSRVSAPPRAVFDAFFREPHRWLCREATVDLRVGGQLRLCWPDGCFEGRFVQVDEPNVARFSWHMTGDPLPETMLVVSTSPTARADQTTLEVEHYGFGAGPDWDLLYVGAVRSWAAYLKNLRAVLEAGVDLREDDE